MRLAVIVLVLLVAAGLAWRFAFAGIAPAVGSEAPGFILPSQEGASVSLKDFRGQWVVLYFYPKDMTTGCTVEARNFQRDRDQYARRNTVVLGISVDSVASHKKFCAKEGLNFKLLSDTSHKVVREYGSLINFGVVRMAARHTFLIDPQGRIARSYMTVDANAHSREVLAALDELQKH